MKFSNVMIVLFAVMVLVSCKQEAENTTETIKTETIEKETVIVKDTVVVAKPEEKGTTVKVSGDGVELNSKDVDVEIKK